MSQLNNNDFLNQGNTTLYLYTKPNPNPWNTDSVQIALYTKNHTSSDYVLQMVTVQISSAY